MDVAAEGMLAVEGFTTTGSHYVLSILKGVCHSYIRHTSHCTSTSLSLCPQSCVSLPVRYNLNTTSTTTTRVSSKLTGPQAQPSARKGGCRAYLPLASA